MNFQGALIKEQGVTFAVVVVRSHVLTDVTERERIRSGFQAVFGSPVVLMAQDGHGTPTYHGRTDLAKFMANVPMHAVPWKEYSLN